MREGVSWERGTGKGTRGRGPGEGERGRKKGEVPAGQAMVRSMRERLWVDV